MKPGVFRIALIALLALGAFLFWRYRQPRFIAGETAPDFTAVLANGETTRLADLRGRFVLLQFWGSWCGPCRAENPYLAALYQRYHPRGFEIFSVGIETNPNAWKRAILNDAMVWKYHTADMQRFDGPIARLYNIHAIPTTFLINPNGVVMGVNLPPDQIAKMLETGLANR